MDAWAEAARRHEKKRAARKALGEQVESGRSDRETKRRAQQLARRYIERSP